LIGEIMLEIFKSGGPVMYPLLACSIIVMTVIIERIIFWVRVNMQRNQSLVDEVLELCRTGDWESVKEKTTGSKDYIIRILITGILHREFSMIRAIITSFDVLGTTGIEHPEAVTAGIAQALLTTATGLGIAILSVFPYNYFNSRVENAALSIEKYATSLEIVYEKLAQGSAAQKRNL
jgi:biopolymer transport protein ExbB